MLQQDVQSLRNQVKDKLKAIKAEAEAQAAAPAGENAANMLHPPLHLTPIRLPGHTDVPYACRWHPHEKLLASG